MNQQHGMATISLDHVVDDYRARHGRFKDIAVEKDDMISVSLSRWNYSSDTQQLIQHSKRNSLSSWRSHALSADRRRWT